MTLTRRALLIPALVALLSTPALAAETVHLTLVGLNQGPIEGDSPQTSLGRENTVACVLFRHALRNATGTRGGVTVTCRKALDRATPLLVTSLRTRELLTMVARFYRPNPSGDGTTEQYYTVEGTQGRVVSIKQLTPDTLTPATAQLPSLEEVVFEFQSLLFRWEPTGAESVFEIIL